METLPESLESDDSSINRKHLKNNQIDAFFSNLRFMSIKLELRIQPAKARPHFKISMCNYDIFLAKDLIDNLAFC